MSLLSSAAPSVAGSCTLPATARPGPWYPSGLRVIARTSCPAAARSSTRRVPTKPVAPATTTERAEAGDVTCWPSRR